MEKCCNFADFQKVIADDFFQCLRLMEVRTMNLMKMKWQKCGES